MSDLPVKLLDSGTLPLHGSHLIEASAGTGKTYNIVRIYLRLLIEKRYSVDQILVMTFTVAATAEIRNRLNEFLREALVSWETSDDPIIVSLRETIESHQAKLLLQQAILHLDEAAIYTIHGFCKRALSQQAFFSGMSFTANMDADTTHLKRLATEDWYRNIQNEAWYSCVHDQWSTPEAFISHWSRVIDTAHSIQRPTITDLEPLAVELQQQWPDEREVFQKLNKATARSNQQTLAAYEQMFGQMNAFVEGQLPLSDIQVSKFDIDKCFSTAKKKQSMPAMFALATHILNNERARNLNYALDGVEYVREHISGDKKQLDQLDFNDLIVELSRALHGGHSEALRAAMLEQFPAALVDEFQDTDPDQYAILQSIYLNQSQSFLCMIGDPKQAIYGFRGGDVFAYLQAKKNVDFQWTMNTNYRSSEQVINGYNQTFLQGDQDQNLDVFGFGIGYRRVLANADKPKTTFTDDRSAVQWVNIQPDELPDKGVNKSFQHTITQWMTNEIIHLLTDVQCNEKPIQPGDIAILVRSFAEAQLVQDYLTDAGLASVYLSARQNVFQTEEAYSLQPLLKGIWQFENDRLFIAALASSWIGLPTQTLDEINHDEHQWSAWQNQFQQWRQEWQSRGLMSMLLDILQNHYQPRTEKPERSLTNRLHLAERLQAQSSQYRLPDALLHWFESALEDDSRSEDNLLRLESDEALLKIITMHGAKGLEYPIVFLPFISYFGKSNRESAVYQYHDRETFELRQAFLASSEEKGMSKEEDQAELIRLLYVAMTRAENRLYGCLAPFTTFAESAIGSTLKLNEFNIDALKDTLSVENAATILSVQESDVHSLSFQSEEKVKASLPAEFNGHIERDWWLSSFSALTRHVGHSGHSAPDRDEQEAIEELPENQTLRFRMAKGAEAGNLLHDTLEVCDFSNPDFETLWQKAAERYRSLTDTFTFEEFREWITEILNTPLGTHGSMASRSLAQTLRESEFYFPMEGTHISALSRWMQKRRGDEYALPDRQKLKGMMHGFIDLIFEKDGQYFVADYKSTHLGSQLTDYHFDAMQHSVYSSSYDLQYAIYMVALHRYLQSRMPNYSPETHLGGVYYLYLRGMHPEHTTGVFYDPFPVDALYELDAIFSRNSAEVDR